MNTNTEPLPLQTAQLESSIQDLDMTLIQVRSVLELLRCTTESMKKHASRLTTIRRDYQRALSPIHRLPVEMLIEIFRWTSIDGDASSRFNISGFNVFEIDQGSWYLSQVCSLWRHTVTTLCPDIWCRFTIEILAKEVEDDDKRGFIGDNLAIKKDMFALFECVLERSCGRSLDFSFRHWSARIKDDDDDDNDNEEMGETEDACSGNAVMYRCFQLLLDQSARWRSAELTLPPSILSKISSVRERFDGLEEIHLLCHESLYPGWITAFEIAPKLRVVHLANFDLHEVVTFSTENLVSMYEDRPFPQEDEISEYLRVTESAQGLLSFTYHYSNHEFQPDGKKPPLVENKSLQTLSASLGKFMSALVFPGLKSMSLTTGSKIPGMFPCADDAFSNFMD